MNFRNVLLHTLESKIIHESGHVFVSSRYYIVFVILDRPNIFFLSSFLAGCLRYSQSNGNIHSTSNFRVLTPTVKQQRDRFTNRNFSLVQYVVRLNIMNTRLSDFVHYDSTNDAVTTGRDCIVERPTYSSWRKPTHLTPSSIVTNLLQILYVRVLAIPR